KENQLYHGIRLTSSPGEFALATLRGGLVIIDANGNLKRIFNKTSGLQDDNVKYIYEDPRGNLWLALAKGVSKIEYASPVSFYNDHLSGLPGLVLSVARFGPKNALWAGTDRGLVVLPNPGSTGNPGRFQSVPGITGQCRDLLPVGDSLLAATAGGVFRVADDHQVKEKIITGYAYVLQRSTTKPNRVLVGTRPGLTILRRDDQSRQWVKEASFNAVTHTVQTIVEDPGGNLWLGTQANGVLKMDFPVAGDILHPVLTHYHQSHGLPRGQVRVFRAAGHVIFAAGKTIYRFNEENRNFVPDFTFGKEYADGSRILFTLAEDQSKQIWFHSKFRNFRAMPRPDGSYDVQGEPLRRIPMAQVNAIYPDPNGAAVWFCGHDGLIRYDKGFKFNPHLDFAAIIREVEVKGTPIMYDKPRYQYNNYNTYHNWNGGRLVIPYNDRDITFKFATPFFKDDPLNEYRCILDGYDDRWSRWNLETRKVYTNLDSGSYTFRVQTRNVFDRLSREALFRLQVLPPWYKTWWAFLFYALAALLVMFLVVKWRSGKLEREKKRLEQKVEQRTKEVYQKNIQLETQTAQLIEQSGQLKEMDRVKSRFFTNISHEFRTPLTVIIGPLEQMLADAGVEEGKEEEKQKLKMMLRNSRRLLYLINQLLDLSKIDSSKMKLQASPQDIVPFLKGVTASFELLTQQKKLDLTFHAPVESLPLYFDTEKMEAVMCNLLVNAVKFTPPGGSVSVTVKNNEEEPGELEILVSDTGPGIGKDQLANIFDRFYQAGTPRSDSAGSGRDVQGTGIGLALTRELVVLHHGKIDVHSTVGDGSGTQFIIRLPTGKDHLDPGEIMETGKPGTRGYDYSEVAALYAADEEERNSEETETVAVSNVNPETGDADVAEENQAPSQEIILVVEDNADARQFIRGALEPLYMVREAADGKQGIEQAKTIIPDLIVSDVMMPHVDGYQLCNTLKKDIKTSHIPIILLTAKAAEESVVKGLGTGADDYITKPFSTGILLARIKNLIGLRRQWQEKVQRQMILQPAEVQVSSMDDEFIKEVQQVIEKNLSNPLFNVELLGKKLYMSRATLYRKIHALTGESPREFIRSYRLKRGAQLLKADFGNVMEVAFEVGFSSTSYFIKCFKKKFNQLPSQY
ncbi:MAG: response regulator, partial [bacterium]|nr:response regulator [bacterium]